MLSLKAGRYIGGEIYDLGIGKTVPEWLHAYCGYSGRSTEQAPSGRKAVWQRGGSG
jgi:hypothetical protein